MLRRPKALRNVEKWCRYEEVLGRVMVLCDRIESGRGSACVKATKTGE